MNGYEPGPVEHRVARRLGVKVSEVMDFLDYYSEEFLAFEKESKAVAEQHGLTDDEDNDDANLAEHTARTLVENAPLGVGAEGEEAEEEAEAQAAAKTSSRARKSRAKVKDKPADEPEEVGV